MEGPEAEELRDALVKGYGIDETPAWNELTEALLSKGYKLLRLERLEPVGSHTFIIKVQNTKSY